MRKLSFLFVLLLLTTFGNISAQNYALHLDGENDKIGIGDNAVLNPASALTLEVWINADSWASSIWAGTIISKQGTSPDQGYCLTVGEDGKAEFTVSIDGAWKSASTSAIMGLNTWYHIAGVYDGSSVKIYINGVLQNTTEIASGTATLSSTSLLFGDNPTWNPRCFNGTIDEIRIWETARAESEIVDNFTSELTGSETGLVGYWNFNEGTGTTLTDITSNGNDGTLLNMDETTVWVEGFVVPTDDVGVTRIVSPYLIGPEYGSTEEIKVEIKNYSAYSITDFDVSYILDSGEPVIETVTETIEPFGTLVYTFSGTEDLSSQTSWTIEAYTTLDGDSNTDNDGIVETVSPSESVFLFDDEQHNFSAAGQTHTLSTSITSNLSGYSQILLHIDLNCPAGGCDPWDQPAFFYLLHENEKYELARYITPYGVACGGWTFDITDFSSILKGSVNFESYIQVWGASGWLLDAELELVPGTPEYEYSTIQRLVIEDYWVYGDETVNPHSPDAVTVPIDADADAVKIRMTTTGHGQGNTNNAAEFYETTHHIWVDGTELFDQYLWKDDCDANTCSPQSGTYLYSRAGWCPGQDIQPWEWNIPTDNYTPGSDLEIEYVLADYTNALNTGYNNNGHTEPHFKIHSYLVIYFNSMVNVDDNEKFIENISVYPNPTSDYINIEFLKSFSDKVSIKMYDVSGKTVYSSEIEKVTENDISAIDVSEFSTGVYTMQIISSLSSYEKKIIIR